MLFDPVSCYVQVLQYFSLGGQFRLIPFVSKNKTMCQTKNLLSNDNVKLKKVMM